MLCSPSPPTRSWLPAAPVAGGSPWLVAGTTLSRYRDGRWASVGPVTPGDASSAPVLATDGAIWQATPKGLVRIEGDEWAVVDEDIGGYARTSLAAGDGGSVWTISDGDVMTVRPDGSRTSIGRPQGSKGLFEGTPLAAGPGVVWTSDSDPTRGLSRLLSWDGQWSDVAVPEPYNGVTQLLVATDGAVWATFDGEDVGQALARYADGRWTIDGGAARGLAQTPSGDVCSIRDAGVACYDAAGLAGGAPVSTYPVDGGRSEHRARWFCLGAGRAGGSPPRGIDGLTGAQAAPRRARRASRHAAPATRTRRPLPTVARRSNTW